MMHIPVACLSYEAAMGGGGLYDLATGLSRCREFHTWLFTYVVKNQDAFIHWRWKHCAMMIEF